MNVSAITHCYLYCTCTMLIEFNMKYVHLGSMLLWCYMYVELGIKQALHLDSFVIF